MRGLLLNEYERMFLELVFRTGYTHATLCR